MKQIFKVLEVMRSITIIAMVTVIGLAFFACKEDGGTTEQPKARMDNQPAQTLTFTGGTGTYSVTVKSADLYLDADWTTTVNSVITAIMRGYGKYNGTPGETPSKVVFHNVFATSNNVVITLSNSAANNCKVDAGAKNTITIKTSSLGTVDLEPAVAAMQTNMLGGNESHISSD